MNSYTPKTLMEYGKRLADESKYGFGETLMRIAHQWELSLAAEREECARVCDRLFDPDYVRDADECAAAIRANNQGARK